MSVLRTTRQLRGLRPFRVSEGLQECHIVLVTQALSSILSGAVDSQQSRSSELFENFLSREYLLLLPDLPVLVDRLLHQPVSGLLQSLLLAVVEVYLDCGGVEAPGDLSET